MGLYTVLTNPTDFKFYGGGKFPNVNAVSSTVSFGQKLIGYNKPSGTFHAGAFLPKEQKPYITVPIPDLGVSFKDQNPTLITLPGWEDGLPGIKQLNNLSEKIRYNSNSWGQDFLNRGNLYGLTRSKDDIKRLTSYFLDGTKGLLFIAKQNLLSRVGVKTESPNNLSNALGFINGGVYLPTSTLAQAAVSGMGGHLLKQGIDPTGKLPLLKLSKYEDANNKKTKRNRLVKILGKFSNFPRSGEVKNKTIEKYRGGPGSVLGIGSTKIKYATDSEGKNKANSIVSRKSLTNKFNGNFLTWDNEDYQSVISNSYLYSITKEDFRSKLYSDFDKRKDNKNNKTFEFDYGKKKYLSLSPNYNPNAENTGNIEKRLNYRSGGSSGNRFNYEKGKRDNVKELMSSDLINMSSIYKSQFPNTDKRLKDTIDFRIGIFDNGSIEGDTSIVNIDKNWLHFRALLNKFSESYKSGWKSQEYMGRAEKFYRYNSFDRDISLDFNLVAFSKQELMPIYKKLNYLASHLAPYYSKKGYMSGNLVQLTVGNYLWEQTGFIESIGIDIDNETPWEVNVGLDGDVENGDINIKQVPHMIKVSIKFTPIHRFRPQIQELEDIGKNPTFKFDKDNIKYSNKKFISLQNNQGPERDGYNILPPLPKDTSNLSNSQVSTTNKNSLQSTGLENSNPIYGSFSDPNNTQYGSTTNQVQLQGAQDSLPGGKDYGN